MWLTTNIVQIYIYRYIFHYSSGKNIKIIKKNHVIYLFVALKLLVICIINGYLVSWKLHAFTTLEYQVMNCITSLNLGVFWITWEINNSKTISFIYTQSLITKYRTVRPCIIYIVFVTLRWLWLNNLSNTCTPRIKCSKSVSSAL